MDNEMSIVDWVELIHIVMVKTIVEVEDCCTDKSKSHEKTIQKTGKQRHEESEEFKKEAKDSKPKPKSQASVKSITLPDIFPLRHIFGGVTKARKYKKVVSPSRKLSPVLEEERTEKPKKAKKPVKKSTTVLTAGVVIRDTLGVPVSKKKAPAKGDRGKGNRVGSQPKGLDELQDKTTGTDEGTSTKPGVPDVPKYLSESENESWGNSGDDDNDDDSDEVTKDDDEDDNDNEEEEHEEEYVRTPNSFEFNDDEEEYDELYKDVDERSYEQVVDDAHVTITTTQKTEADNEVASMMNVKVCQEESSTLAPPLLIVPVTAITETSTIAATPVPLITQPFSSILQMTTSTPVPTTEPTTSSIPALLDFASLFGFDQRVSALEREISQVKQVDHSAQIPAQIPAIVDEHLNKYIDIIEKSVKEIIKDEVKSQLPQILPKEISDFATLVIQSTINESLENVILDKSSSQPQSTYEAASSLTEFELKKILLDKLDKGKLYRVAKQHSDLYDALVKSYQLDKDLFDSYGKVYSLKRVRDDKDKDEDPPAGSDQGLKKRKTRKDVEPSRGSKSKESKSSSSKGSKSQSKSSAKSAQADELVFETADIEMPQAQRDDLGNTEDQPNVKEASKHD
ncbi:hypothetical protein Tco_1195132 [Tanacetum coccineum]